MDFVIITIVSVLVAALTLVSGFGLGTLLLPAFAIFFPVEIAIAATAVVHFVNNLFRLGLVARWAQWDVVVRFGVPAVFAAFIGAGLMSLTASTLPLVEYRLGPFPCKVTLLKLVIAILLAVFAGLELWPRYEKMQFPRKSLPIGGALSGFFGGISGMQGALRAPFLLHIGLTKQQFVGTTNVISTIVDVARLITYAVGFTWLVKSQDYQVLTESRVIILVIVACIGGCIGSVIGARLIKKITRRTIRFAIAGLLFLSAIALGSGVI